MTTAPGKLELPFLHADYQKDLKVLFYRWRTPVTLTQFMEGYNAVLQLATQKEAYFRLHDLRLRNTSGAGQKQWFASTFVPALQRELGNSNFIAYLVSPLQHEQTMAIAIPRAEATNYSNKLAIRYFTNEHDTLEWLKECRQRNAV